MQKTLIGGSGLAPICGICCRPINERFLLRVSETSYHETCLQCCVCCDRLMQTCFVRDSKLYCRIDYERLYIKKCLGCSERITPEELVMRASDNIFHLRCFVCVVCGIRLQKGDLYVIKQGQLFCRIDYEKEVEMLQGYGHGDFLCDDMLQSSRNHDGRRGPKRPRTILTTQQRRAFKASFEISPKPCRKVRETLAKDTGLSVRIVQVWFQNQRAKMKKMQKKARQDNKNHKDTGESDEKKLHVKEEEQSPTSTPFFNDSCSDTETTGDVERLHQHQGKHFLQIKEEIENDGGGSNGGIGGSGGIGSVGNVGGGNVGSGGVGFFKCATPMSLHRQFTGMPTATEKNDDNYMSVAYETAAGGMFMLPPALGGHHHVGMHTHPHHVGVVGGGGSGGGAVLNPIDRLYSMQNSYFCADDEHSMMD